MKGFSIFDFRLSICRGGPRRGTTGGLGRARTEEASGVHHPRNRKSKIENRKWAAAIIAGWLLPLAPLWLALAQSPDFSSVRAAEKQRIEVFAQAAKAVVCIFAAPERGGGGSGVVISPEGYGLTNFHVVQEFAETRRGFGGLCDGKLYPLRLLGIDPGGDIALFKLEGKPAFDFAPLGDSDTLRVGQSVAAMGNPFLVAEDFTPTITLGIVSGLHRYQEGQGNLLEYADCIQVSSSINPGNSGGPLFDMSGRVMGINGRGSFEERGRVNVGLGYAITAKQIKRFLPGLRAGRLVEHGTLGATTQTLGDDLVVNQIQDYSPAEKAGLQLGDHLLSIAGRRVFTPNDFNNVVATLPADWPVTLTYRRGEGLVQEGATRLERLSLRVPMVYVPDLAHNHAEIDGVFSRHGRTLGITPSGRPDELIWRGRIQAELTGDDAEFEVCARQRAADSLPSTRVPPADFIESFNPVDSSAAAVTWRYADVWDEWRWMTGPLLGWRKLDLDWEMLAGDEVAGRVAWVVQRRIGETTRMLWKFDYETDELLEVVVVREAPARSSVWRPQNAEAQAPGLPRAWRRTSFTGETLTVELDEAQLVSYVAFRLRRLPDNTMQKESG